jgi:hypothetical protein
MSAKVAAAEVIIGLPKAYYTQLDIMRKYAFF